MKDNMTAKVLVIMATYNGEKYLQEQLDSIFQQENVRVDILVRDDGSNDNTKEILENYSKNNRLKWYTGEHLNVQKGYFDLMNRATELEWDYIAFSDQDDVWDVDKLYIAIKKLNEWEEEIPKLYYCGQKLVDKDLKYISDHTLNKERSLNARFILSDFAGCTGVFNRNLLYAVLKYTPQYILMHDTWILKVCLAIGGRVFVDTGMHMQYRQHENNSLGLGSGFRGKLKQVAQYINVYKVEPQMKELLLGYEKEILPEYKEIAEDICTYRFDMKKKVKLLKNIDFCNSGLNLTYRIKIIFNRL